MVDLDPNKQPEASWETTYDPEISWKNGVFEAVNSMRDAQDSVDHYRMHLRHYQEEVRDLKSEIESLKIQLRGSQDRAQMIFRAKNEWADRARKSFEGIQERQAELVTAPATNDAYPHRRAEGWLVEKIPFDQTFPCIAWATSEESPEAGDKALLHYSPPVSCSDDEIPRYAGSYNGVWLSPTDEKGLAKAQLISLNNTDSDFYPSIDEIQERQARDEADPLVDNRFYADAVSNPDYDGPHKKYSSDDGLWAIACGRGAAAGTGELTRVQIISVKEQHNEP